MSPTCFFLRLIPPRPTFPFDMSAEERELMARHATYTRQFFDSGAILAFGPVFDTDGAFGFAILNMRTLHDAEQFAQADPTIQAGPSRYTLSPMHLGGAQSPVRPTP